MGDHDSVEQWLRGAMESGQPQLSSSFDARVMERVRPSRLASWKRAVLAAYAVGSLLLTFWMMRDVGLVLAAASTLAGAAVAVALSTYVRTVTRMSA